jgi:hypothetical protein
MHDFALNDPLVDLLYVNNQEITTLELKEPWLWLTNKKKQIKKRPARAK